MKLDYLGVYRDKRSRSIYANTCITWKKYPTGPIVRYVAPT